MVSPDIVKVMMRHSEEPINGKTYITGRFRDTVEEETKYKIPNVVVVDDFYDNPDEIRDYALNLKYAGSR